MGATSDRDTLNSCRLTLLEEATDQMLSAITREASEEDGSYMATGSLNHPHAPTVVSPAEMAGILSPDN